MRRPEHVPRASHAHVDGVRVRVAVARVLEPRRPRAAGRGTWRATAAMPTPCQRAVGSSRPAARPSAFVRATLCVTPGPAKKRRASGARLLSLTPRRPSRPPPPTTPAEVASKSASSSPSSSSSSAPPVVAHHGGHLLLGHVLQHHAAVLVAATCRSKNCVWRRCRLPVTMLDESMPSRSLGQRLPRGSRGRRSPRRSPRRRSRAAVARLVVHDEVDERPRVVLVHAPLLEAIRRRRRPRSRRRARPAPRWTAAPRAPSPWPAARRRRAVPRPPRRRGRQRVWRLWAWMHSGSVGTVARQKWLAATARRTRATRRARVAVVHSPLLCVGVGATGAFSKVEFFSCA